MFEGAVAGFLNRLLGKYVQDLDTENLNVGIFSGNVNLSDLKLKPEALYELDLPIDVKIGTIGRVSLQIPWTGLYTQPVVVNIEDVFLLVGPAISNSCFDPERERRLTRAAKRKILQDLEAESEILKGPRNFFEHLFTAIVNNIQIYVRNVHVRYEDSISSKDGPLACGLCLQSLSIETTNSKWKPSVTPQNASTVYQMMRVESLSLYWNPVATTLDDVEIANITPVQYYTWKHYMLTGLDKFSMHREDFEFLLKPVTCKVKVLINRSGEARVPRLLLDAVLQDSALQISRKQYLSINNLLSSFARIKLNRKYRHLHPGLPLSKDVKKWWRYAYNVVVEQRVRPYTWAAIKKHRDNYTVYKQTYKTTLRSPNDTELKLDLQKCEDSLPIISVVIAREQAKFELLSQEPDRIEVVESEFDWWKPTSSSSDSDIDDPNAHIELCVKTERSKTLWSHLSSPEKKKVCELIGYVEGEPSKDRSKQYIEHKLNLTLANCSLTLMNRSKEVLVVSLTQFLVSLETRPSVKAYKISARAESIVVEGATSDGELVPLITAEKGTALTGTNLLAVDFEKNPSNIDADYSLCWLMEPIELLYVEHAFTELINFLQTHSMTSEDLAEGVTNVIYQAGNISKSVLAYAVNRRKVFQVNVDIKGPCLVIPEYGYVQKSGQIMVLDISRIIIRSDLQPSNLVLEDATCMELEERLYDRLHAECSYQVLFFKWNDPWHEQRKYADSELHLIPKIKMQVVFSNSIKKDYKLLPRYKLNISLSSFKLNLSDGVISQLLDFCDNLPIPVPNTVPVSFMDSGDYTEDAEDPALGKLLESDRVTADPGYKELVNLRQKIVFAYLKRNRVSESTFDKTSAKQGFQESDHAFSTSEHSEEDLEIYARCVDLPGFEDNVSPSNNINVLMRFIVGEIVVNLSRTTDQTEDPYIMLSITKVCLDVALMEYGPAIQLSINQALLTDKQHHTNSGQYLELITSSGELFNLLYRKVRADCPEFKSHFHSVEQALVADTGHVSLLLHADALRALTKYLQIICNKIQYRQVLNIKKTVLPKTTSLWNYLMKPDADPPVPSGATKFSYSVRASSVSIKLCHLENSMLEMKLTAVESDCVFRANDRMIFKLFLSSLQLDDLSEATLYPKLVWPDEDKVLEVKYVRTAPRLYGSQDNIKAHGELRIYLGRLHVVMFCSILSHFLQFLEPLIPTSMAFQAAQAAEKAAEQHAEEIRSWATRLNLVIEIHAPVLLLPQKPSSPNLLVLNMGDLQIENFFKQFSTSQEVSSPGQSPVIDNILIKLVNISFSRAVMTLAGTLEVQEPILEPMCIRCDLKRAVCYQQMVTMPAYRDLLAFSADTTIDTIYLNIGQKDLGTFLAVWCDNFSEGHYVGNITPSSPVETGPVDTSVKKLQAFLAQGEPIKKETILRFIVEGIELKLFSDMEEVLSSPVRDFNNGVAKFTAGEATLQLEYSSDDSLDLRASLQSLLIEDIRSDPSVSIRRIFQSQGGSRCASDGGCISVRRPPLIDVSVHVTAAKARQLDVRVDRTRLNLALPFLVHLVKTLIMAVPGEKTMDGGVVNHGYVGDPHPSKSSNNNRAARLPSSSDSTSGYCSTGTSVSDEPPGLSVSIQFRQPEIMFFTDMTKTEGHALLLRTELMIDYSYHSNIETLVVSMAGLQIMSKLQSKLKNLPPQTVLKPCDIEYSKSVKSSEEEMAINLKVSEVEIHIAPTTVHTVNDIIDEMISELMMVDEKDILNFPNYVYKPEKHEEDLWSPKKLTPYVLVNNGNTYVRPERPPVPKPSEIFLVTIPSLKILFEIEQNIRVPVLVMKLATEMSLYNWSNNFHGSARMSIIANCYDERADVWEPLIEPVLNTQRPWEITVSIFQAKAYPLSSKLETKQQETESDAGVTAEQMKKAKKRNEFDSETSTDEYDTDNEMTFIRNPNGGDAKHYNVDFSAANMSFLGTLDAEESDSDNENGLMDKLATAIGHLITDDSSAEDISNNDDSSDPEQCEPDVLGDHEEEKAVTSTDGEVKKSSKTKKDTEQKTVTLKEPTHEDSVDSGLETESSTENTCTYMLFEAKDMLNVSITPAGARALLALDNARTDRTAAVSAIVIGESGIQLNNDIGPGSTVHLKTKSETDLAGNDRVIAVADYDVDTSRPSTPGCDTSSGDMLEETDVKTKPEVSDVSDEWDCFEGGFPGGPTSPAQAFACSPIPTLSPTALYTKLTDLTLTVKLHDFENLTILCPQRSVSKLHVLHPSKNGTRYYIVVERTAKYTTKKIVVRSPLQIRNETSYAMELFYKKTDLQAIGVDLIGSLTNPFDDKMRLCVIAPQDTYNVPLYIAYHCKLFLLPSNFESYQTATQGIWWMELANDIGMPRDMVCPAKLEYDNRIFAMRILTVEGSQMNRVPRSIPNYLLRVVPPLAVYNRLPYAVEVHCAATDWRVRIEAGERTHTYTMQLNKSHKITVDMHYMGFRWSGIFTLTPDVTDKTVSMTTDCEMDDDYKQVFISALVERNDCWELFFYAQYWLINKTELPLQMKISHSDTQYRLNEEPMLWTGIGRSATARRGLRVRFRAHHSGWSRACRLAVAAPGLVVCPHHERRTNYRILLNVTLSELCPQLTKIVTLLPYFLVHNDTKRHLRFMEENEAADLWIDLTPQQCAAFWPQTDSLAMHVKYRDSNVISQHFPIARNHFTILRMDKGSAIAVEVAGGTERPFTITFKPYSCGDAPVRIDNLCDDLFLKLHQVDSGQVALLSPYQSLIYTWDDPTRERKLMWNIYNNKGKGFFAAFEQDGFGEEKVSFHSVKHSTAMATSSVTSKLSSTLKRLTPKSPEPCSSSSDDSDNSQLPESHSKNKKMRKDKVVVYWTSYMDGYQRVFSLAQDERIAAQHQMRINAEKSYCEMYFSIPGMSLSVCVQTNSGVKDFAYASITDSLPRWEVNVNNKWKQLSPELTNWIEDKYQCDQKKCALKEYIHMDLDKMQMTKPFFAELRRTYNPGLWAQIRKSNTLTFTHLKCQRLQIDNQMHEAVFPSVLYPAPVPADVKSSEANPCLEIVTLKQYRPSVNREVYKYLKVSLQEYCINLDRGFINHVFEILNHWKVEEKPAVRLRADLALVYMPIPIIALRTQNVSQKNMIFEYVHLSPIKLLLSLSSRGHFIDTGSPGKTRLGNKKENRRKLFNSDLLEYLFNSWGSSLCDMKDVALRMSYLELRNAPITGASLMKFAYRHYWIQLIQQFHVLVLGLSILGNPYVKTSQLCDNSSQNYYEPHVGTVLSRKAVEVSRRLGHAAASLLGLCACPDTKTTSIFQELPRTQTPKRRPGEQLSYEDFPPSMISIDCNNPASVAVALSALVARPTYDLCRQATRASLTNQGNMLSAEQALKSCVERSGGRLVSRIRMPRYCSSIEGIKPYSQHAALGVQLCRSVMGVHSYGEEYIGHAYLPNAPTCTLLITTRNIYMVRAGGSNGACNVEWAIPLNDIIEPVTVVGDQIKLRVKQNEVTNYLSIDEKVIEVGDVEVMNWLKSKIEYALILALEDKRCPVEP